MRKQLCYDQCGANCEEHVWSYQVIPNPETRINTKYQYDLVEMFQENVQPGDPNIGARRYMIYVCPNLSLAQVYVTFPTRPEWKPKR